MFAHALAHRVAGKSVQMHRCKHRFERLPRMLRYHPRDHTRQDVSRTARGHARIACRIDPGFPVGLRHQCAMAFEHDDHLMFARELSRYSQSIFLNLINVTSGQPRHLSRMRSDYNGSAFAIQFSVAALECKGRTVVITPHPGEMARLAGCNVDE